MKCLTDKHLYADDSDILAENLESLLEASQELRHVAEKFVLVLESAFHFIFEISHKSVSLVLSVVFEFVEEFVC